MDLRIATFNIAGAINRDDRFYSSRGDARTRERVAEARAALDRIAEVVRERDIAILALQEVDVCHNGDDTLFQARYLAERLGMNHSFSPSFDYNIAGRIRVTTGVATLSRFEIRSARPIVFSQRRVRPIRRLKNFLLGAKRALVTSLQIRGTRLEVINAHLTHDCDAQKQHELETLLAHAARRRPCVLLGDLNTTPLPTRGSSMRESAHFYTDGCMEILERYRPQMQCDARVFGPEVAQICSYPSGGPDIKLDYVLLFADEMTLGRDNVFAPVGDSNHLPVGNVIQGVP